MLLPSSEPILLKPPPRLEPGRRGEHPLPTPRPEADSPERSCAGPSSARSTILRQHYKTLYHRFFLSQSSSSFSPINFHFSDFTLVAQKYLGLHVLQNENQVILNIKP